MSESTAESDPSRCAWCAGEDGDLKRLRLRVPDQIALNRLWVELGAHPRHERPLRRFLARYRRDGRRFVLAALASILVPIAFYTALHLVEPPAPVRERWSGLFLGVYLTGLGSLFFLCPFVTSLTNRLLGVRTSILVVRGAGVVFAGFGIYYLAAGLL